MSLAVCKSCVPLAPLGLEGGGVRGGERAFSAPSMSDMSSKTWLVQEEEVTKKEVVDQKDGQFDMWSSIQSSSQKKAAAADLPAPYVHPLMRRSASSLSQRSLEICTESLGSETGSDGFCSDDLEGYLSSKIAGEEEQVFERVAAAEEEGEEEDAERRGFALRNHGRRKELADVNYHCSIGRRSLPRSFPPPLPSISRRDGPCLHMRPHRRDGRLVVEAVPVPSQNYLHAKRQGGRLLLTFIDTSFQEIYPRIEEDPIVEQQQQRQPNCQEAEPGADDGRGLPENAVADGCDDSDMDIDEYLDDMGEEEEEEEGEEVEVVDRGNVVEVKVSRQPQLQSGGMKVHRSSLVINKFIGGTPLSSQNPWAEKAERMAEEEEEEEEEEAILPKENHRVPAAAMAPPRQLVPNSSSTTTTAAAAAAVASSSSNVESCWGNGKRAHSAQHNTTTPIDKLHFTSKKMMNRQALLHQVRRCSQHHRPLFIWEPCCIATS